LKWKPNWAPQYIWAFLKTENPFLLPRIELRFLGSPTPSLVAIPSSKAGESYNNHCAEKGVTLII
jgi:hypothetical protein